ncbi:MAG: sulfotransferase [Holophagales bacterium]|nr:sulfotransferase [Holophagales bacterium]MYG31747.1 sulfotransferase [Holophagales bacterium]MYI79589.1 sulfotransferase [Holophagales bacterium]
MSARTLWRRFRYGRPIVVVSGLPRSGTSMAMRMLEAGGMEVVTDGEREADEDNPRGYYEDERVKDLANAPDKSWLRASRGRAVKVISFLLKDLPPNLNYSVILMRRDLTEVLASQRKMLNRRNETDDTPDERMMELWQDQLWRVNYLLRHAPQFEWVEIDYGEALRNPAAAATRVAGLVDGLDERAMAEVVDPALYRNRTAP